MKKLVVYLLCVLVCLCFVGCGGETDEPTNISYQTVTLKDMYQVYDKNKARFEAQYKDQYLSITGEVSYIGGDDYFSINQYVYDSAGRRVAKYVSASARVENDLLKSLVLKLNEGDTVIIRGKVVDFSYTVDCSVIMDVYEIKLKK